jgi:hypothetical protein
VGGGGNAILSHLDFKNVNSGAWGALAVSGGGHLDLTGVTFSAVSPSSGDSSIVGGGTAIIAEDGGSVNMVNCKVVHSNSDSSSLVENGAECFELGIGTGLVRCIFADGSDAGFDSGLFLADNSSRITMKSVTLSNGRTGLRSITGTGFAVEELFHQGEVLTPWNDHVKAGNGDGHGRRIGKCRLSKEGLMSCFPDTQAHCLQQYPCSIPSYTV